MAAGLRLDGELWEPTVLGTTVPHGLLRELAAGGEWSYRPLLRTHLAPGRLEPHVARSVQVVEDRAAWDALGDEPEVAPHRPPGAPSRWVEGRSTAVVLRDSRGEQFQGVILAELGPDPRLATVVVNWLWNAMYVEAARARDTLAAAWLCLFRSLAGQGAVGVRANEMMMGRRFVAHLREVAGFRPGAEVVAELGLSPADAQQVVCEWRATVDDDTVVRFGTRPELAPDARRQLITELAAAQGPAGPSTPAIEPLPGFRQTLRGEVFLDGPHGTGSGPAPGDWFDAPPDAFPEGADWMRRGRTVLARWLRDQAGSG